MNQKRRTNGQFAPSLTGKKGPTAAAKFPRTTAPKDLDALARSFVSQRFGIPSNEITLGSRPDTVVVGGEELKIKVTQMVLTDWGQAKGAVPHTVFTLRRPGMFQKDLTEDQVAEIRSRIAGS
jgi:hypothetical protein